MIALFGPPPRKLIEQERYWRNIPWERAFPNKDGIWVHTAREYYGGPFFDPEGNIEDLPPVQTLVQAMFLMLLQGVSQNQRSFRSVEGLRNVSHACREKRKNFLSHLSEKCYSGYQKIGKLRQSFARTLG